MTDPFLYWLTVVLGVAVNYLAIRWVYSMVISSASRLAFEPTTLMGFDEESDWAHQALSDIARIESATSLDDIYGYLDGEPGYGYPSTVRL